MSFSYTNTVLLSYYFQYIYRIAVQTPANLLSVSLFGMLHKQMQPLPCSSTIPCHETVPQAPTVKSVKSLMLHFTACHIRSVRQRGLCSPFFIPEYIKYLPPSTTMRTGHRNHLRASTFQGKRSGTPGDLAAVPHLPVMPDNPVLRDVAVRVAPIGSNVGIAACIGLMLVWFISSEF